MSLKCQRCDEAMQTIFYEGVAIKYCMDCKGVFLSEKKLEIIKGIREEMIPRDLPTPRKAVEVGQTCPKCETSMKKRKHGRLRRTIIDYCESCTGIWLDKNELASIQLSFEIAEDNRLKNSYKSMI